MAVNIEDAGFEIRDIISWIYATGFPKSLDISKAIDKSAGVERVKIANPLAKQQTSSIRTIAYGDYNSVSHITPNPITELAIKWDGWGTALKPATELWTLARKPLNEPTVAENVIKHGTGGINIDATRIPTTDNTGRLGGVDSGMWSGKKQIESEANQLGRFPSNLILDEYTASLLDKQSGIRKSGTVSPDGYIGEYTGNVFGKFKNNTINPDAVYGDECGASRFFFVAKPSDYERQRGLKNFIAKDPASVTDFRPTLKSNPENWANGTETPYTRTTPKKNNHPTVKPIELMRYLVRLVTPKEGIVLDPFNGSGTTGIAAKMEGMNYVGIEQDEYFCKISEARIAVWRNIEQQKLF